MLYTLKNNDLTVQLSDVGAELISAKRGTCEYVWVGNPEYWSFHAPLVFPVCGRFFDGKYTYRGNTYDILCHGFVRPSHFSVAYQDDTSICFSLCENEETLKVYPFRFIFRVWYLLDGSRLTCRFVMENPGDEILPITVGGHPGFNVPLDGKGDFGDYYLEFGSACSPDELVFSDTCFNTGKKRAYPLEEGRILRLKHELFSVDAVFLGNVAPSVTLKSAKTERYVTLTYPDMPYLGIWHRPRTDAPYVCIEPWCGLPGYDGVIEDLESKPDMFRLQPGASKNVEFSMFFG